MKKLLVLVSNYRSKENPYANAFVHSRVKAYLEYGLDVFVFVLNNKASYDNYEIDGVNVVVGKQEDLCLMIEKNNISDICAHFLSESMISAFNAIQRELHIAVVVHGDEALHWYHRLFPGWISNFRLFLGTIHGAYLNVRWINAIKRFLATTNHELEFVAVSNWMKETAEKTWNCKGKYKWNIIPNIVDSSRFHYVEKNEDARFSMLSIRPFINGKYGNDITARVLVKLSARSIDNKIKMRWIGTGVLYKQTIKKVKGLEFVHLENRLLQQETIPSYHEKCGLFICPTRQDAQGVSMCEAMSSGLIPITLYNTAIPEFLPNDQRLICNDESEIVKLIEYLWDNPKEFQELSKKCSEFIREKCSFENTVLKEIALFN